MTSLKHLIEATTLVDLLRYRATERPNAIAYTFLVDGEREKVSLTYGELDRQASAIAVYLQSYCSPGERALLVYPPGLDYIVAFFGCLYAGVVAVPAYPPRPNRSLKRLQTTIEDAQLNAILTTRSVFASLERQLSHTPQLKTLHWLATDEIDETLASEWHSPKIDGNHLAFLQYTSGSTAEPKGVMITHANLLHNLSWIYRRFEHNPQSKGVIWLPLYHDMGLIGGVLQPLYGGFPVILMSPLMFLQSPIRWLQAISRYRATTSGGPGFAYNLASRKVTPEQLADLDLSSWEVAFNGSEAISHEILEQFVRTFEPCGFRREAFYPCYGMAEATLIVSGGKKSNPVTVRKIQPEALANHLVAAEQNPERPHRTIVGCGHSLSDQTAIVVNPETLTQCKVNEVGEIWVSGKSIALGYWNQPEASERIFRAYLADTGEGPYLRTGDLGFIDNGEIFVTGRLKDVIIINGRNYYPQDIEWTVEQIHPSLKANGAAGFSVEVDGEEKLVIVAELERSYLRQMTNGDRPTNGNGNGSGLEKEQLLRSIRRTISQEYDLPVHAALLLKPGAIPKTSSGKIQRYVCRENYLAGTLETL